MTYLKWLKQAKVKTLFFIGCVGLLGLVFAVRVYATQNYSDPDGPRFVGVYAETGGIDRLNAAEKDTEEISVISYNIRYALKMDEAVAELADLRDEKGADIILLQEMDEFGVERLAQELGMNYIYYPAGIEPVYSHNFGNAILSKWPISETQKIFLPHRSLTSGMNRVVTRAIVTVDGVDILVYSIHAETIMTFPNFRQDQFETILTDVDADAKYVIVGGDFNTVTTADVENLIQLYQEAGFDGATVGTGHTLTRYRVDAVADHIFSKGFTVADSGKVAGATGSDHLPIWTTLILDH